MRRSHGTRPIGDRWDRFVGRDNAAAKRCHATLEQELIVRRHSATRDEARQAIFCCAGCWYNLKRRHSALGYVSPAV
jgi:transposase InsO family protein